MRNTRPPPSVPGPVYGGGPNVEPPSPLARIGRGYMDLLEPLKQSYLNMTDAPGAQAYRAQRGENERLYQRGLLSADPNAGQSAINGDMWRMLGRTAPSAILGPFVANALPATLPEVYLSTMLTGSAYDALGAAHKRSGIAPWLELPNVFK